MTGKLDAIETRAVDLVAKVAPWCAPIPTAYLVGRATVAHLAWPEWVAATAAIVIETLGLASTTTALELYQYNRSRRKSDAGAPFVLALALVLLYFSVATGLTVALDIFPGWAVYSPAIFPALSLTGITVLALRSDHKRRLAAIAQDKAERRAQRQARREAARQPERVKSLSSDVKPNRFDRMLEARRAKLEKRLEALLDAFAGNPEMSIAEAAAALQVSRQTVYSYVDTLETAGRLHRNGGGWEVLQ